MYKRLLRAPFQQRKSFFLFGPRGTGKTTWLKASIPDALYIDLLDSDTYSQLVASPARLEAMVASAGERWVVIDEVQKIPQLLNEVHRLIERDKKCFVLTGSSSRSLRKKGVNLLAGRAHVYHMHPFIPQELGQDFNFIKAVQYGLLPGLLTDQNPKGFLSAYVKTYIREEVLQEGLTRNLGYFTRFLEVASFSQGNILTMTNIAEEVGVNRKQVERYFGILEDLLLSYRIYPFTKHAKRRMVAHPKFYFFDVGIYKTLKPLGPLDVIEETDGAALETVFMQVVTALNDYYAAGFSIHYWRTPAGVEVDFILYGEKGLFAFEIKHTKNPKTKDFRGLKHFKQDYPMAKCFLLCQCKHAEQHGEFSVLPISDALTALDKILGLA